MRTRFEIESRSRKTPVWRFKGSDKENFFFTIRVCLKRLRPSLRLQRQFFLVEERKISLCLKRRLVTATKRKNSYQFFSHWGKKNIFFVSKQFLFFWKIMHFVHENQSFFCHVSISFFQVKILCFVLSLGNVKRNGFVQ